jgi:hypothetical protein
VIELLLKLLDKLTKLTELRAAHKRKAFKELAEPMFNELQEVHKNYLTNFVEARRLVEQSSDLQPCIDFLRKQAVEYGPVRSKLQTTARTIFGIHKPTEMSDLVSAILSYFPMGELAGPDGLFSTSHKTLIEELERSAWDAKCRGISNNSLAAERIRQFLMIHEVKWESVCEAFAKAKIADVTAA